MVEFTVQEPINMVPLLYPQHCEPPDDKEVGCYGIRSKVNLHYVKQHQCALEEDFPYKGKRTEDLIPMDRPRLFFVCEISLWCIPCTKFYTQKAFIACAAHYWGIQN